MSYKAVLLHGTARLRSIQAINCKDDLSAMLVAKRLLQGSPTCVAIEVWRDGRRIGKLLQPTEALVPGYPGAA